MRIVKGITALIFTILLLTPILSCGCSKDTSDLEKLQEITPFTIILPTYLPEELESHPPKLQGPIEGTISEDSVWVRILYQEGGENNHFIIIDEENSPTEMLPSQEPYTYIDMAGVNVLEQETDIALHQWTNSSTKSEIAHGLLYSWNQDGVHFDVEIYGYDQDEGRKIVESMIRQIAQL